MYYIVKQVQKANLIYCFFFSISLVQGERCRQGLIWVSSEFVAGEHQGSTSVVGKSLQGYIGCRLNDLRLPACRIVGSDFFGVTFICRHTTAKPFLISILRLLGVFDSPRESRKVV